MSKDTYGQNMRLFTTFFGQHKTFKLMPVSNDCPFMDVIYDPTVQMLVVLSKTMKENYEMLPKLDDIGELQPAKKPKMNGKNFKEERRLMHVPQEYYMTEREEQEEFITQFAVNAEEYDFESYLDKIPEPSEILQNQDAGKILDDKGNPISMKPVK